MSWLVVFEHPDPREVDDRGDRHVRRVQVDTSDCPDDRPAREHAIHLGWRQNARIALEQDRPLYDFVSADELDETGQPVQHDDPVPEAEPEPRRRWWQGREP